MKNLRNLARTASTSSGVQVFFSPQFTRTSGGLSSQSGRYEHLLSTHISVGCSTPHVEGILQTRSYTTSRTSTIGRGKIRKLPSVPGASGDHMMYSVHSYTPFLAHLSFFTTQDQTL